MRKNKVILVGFLMVSAFSLAADSPPVKKKPKISLHDLLLKQNDSPQRTNSVAGVRGLDETQGDVNAEVRDFPAVQRLEQQVITRADELLKFMVEGKLR